MDLDYQSLIAQIANCSIDNKIAFLREQLPSRWRQAYERMSHREMSLVCIRPNSFEFVYDNYSYLEVSGAIPYSLIEDRLVAVLGTSEPPSITRDDYRLLAFRIRGKGGRHRLGFVVDRASPSS